MQSLSTRRTLDVEGGTHSWERVETLRPGVEAVYSGGNIFDFGRLTRQVKPLRLPAHLRQRPALRRRGPRPPADARDSRARRLNVGRDVDHLCLGRWIVSTGGRRLLLQAGWGAAPGKVLYVGDHMASDLLEPAQVRPLPCPAWPPRPNAFSDRFLTVF
eukprot:COSAG01_NODE_13404_length_1590_cov_1.486251_2_plen_159_part_00